MGYSEEDDDSRYPEKYYATFRRASEGGSVSFGFKSLSDALRYAAERLDDPEINDVTISEDGEYVFMAKRRKNDPFKGDWVAEEVSRFAL